MTIIVELYKDKMTLVDEGKSITVLPSEPYTTTRLIVGTFLPAVACLKDGLQKLEATTWYKPKPLIKLKVKEMNEGGLSQIEERCLIEMCKQAGARKVEII